jgi:rod shape determining protein RodA
MATTARDPATTIIERRRNRPDAVLLGSVVALSSFGLLMIYAATRQALEQTNQTPTFDMERQMIFFTAGLILMFLFTALDYRELRNYYPLIYGTIIVLLGSVFLFRPINGARSWIPLGGFFNLQPSEFAKIAIIIGVASVLSQSRTEGRLEWRTVLFVTGFVALPSAMVLMQPDLGTTMVLPIVLVAMMFAAGLSWKQLTWIVTVGAGVLGTAWQNRNAFLHEHQLNRILVFINPELDPQGIGFQLKQSKLAIGSGQLFGKGLFTGTQTVVPEQQNDFIFSVIGEQFGFIGGILVLAVFLIIVWRLFVIASNSRDRFGSLVAVGIAAMIGFHVFVNIGMTVGVAPVTGLPLPFISQGGSFYLAMAMSIGIANSVWMRRSPVPGETYIV